MTATRATPKPVRYLTLEEFEALGREHDPCELWDGVVSAHEPSAFFGTVVCGRLVVAIAEHVRGKSLGWVGDSNAGYRLALDPPRVLSPDISFVRRDRMPRLPRRGFAPFAPDLAVEVRSPRDSWTYVLQRGGIWIAHGVPVVWLVDPLECRAVTMKPLDPPVEIGAGGRLDAAPVLPGLTLALDELCADIEPEA